MHKLPEKQLDHVEEDLRLGYVDDIISLITWPDLLDEEICPTFIHPKKLGQAR